MKFRPDPECPDGEIRGYGATGALVVRKTYTPVYKRLVGTEADEDLVVEWRMSVSGWNRMKRVKTWVATGAHTEGNA